MVNENHYPCLQTAPEPPSQRMAILNAAVAVRAPMFSICMLPASSELHRSARASAVVCGDVERPLAGRAGIFHGKTVVLAFFSPS